MQVSYSQPTIPKIQTFQPVGTTRSSEGIPPAVYGQYIPVIPNDPYTEQNREIMQRGGMTVPGPSASNRIHTDELRRALKEENVKSAGPANMRSIAFKNNLLQLLELNPDSFSITKAVYLSESAYYDNSVLPTYEQFEIAIKKRATLVKQILRREGLNEKDEFSVNYAIQKLYTQENIYFDSVSRSSFLVKRFGYDFDDYMGDKDWTKMYVTKLLHSGSGQCHSLPLIYLCIAEQFHIKAYLSLAPNHSFIQFFDKQGNRYNFEATNGNLVTQTWLMQSAYVNATAVKNKTYLDTLSNRALFAQCLGDLLLSYLMKTGYYDDFSELIVKKIFDIDPNNLTALMEQANRKYAVFQNAKREAGNPSQEKYTDYPRLFSAYNDFNLYKERVARTGFQEMPKDTYQQWLQSLETEKQKQQNRLEQERMQREILRIKNMRSTLNVNKKD